MFPPHPDVGGDGGGEGGDDGEGHGDAPGPQTMVHTVHADPDITVGVIRRPEHPQEEEPSGLKPHPQPWAGPRLRGWRSTAGATAATHGCVYCS